MQLMLRKSIYMANKLPVNLANSTTTPQNLHRHKQESNLQPHHQHMHFKLCATSTARVDGWSSHTCTHPSNHPSTRIEMSTSLSENKNTTPPQSSNNLATLGDFSFKLYLCDSFMSLEIISTFWKTSNPTSSW